MAAASCLLPKHNALQPFHPMNAAPPQQYEIGRQKGQHLMNNTSITLTTGQILNVGDTFYYCSPEYHDGTIEEYIVDSFWPGDSRFGCRIRFACKGFMDWAFVYQDFF